MIVLILENSSKKKGMIAIIPSRHMWGEEESRQYRDSLLYYNQDGQVFY